MLSLGPRRRAAEAQTAPPRALQVVPTLRNQTARLSAPAGSLHMLRGGIVLCAMWFLPPDLFLEEEQYVCFGQTIRLY